ncbi:hypothetical protein O1L60_01530 [Streptomyces diastatochromogenes]|nr:hypothetical protein [Streptomyces diastatochromogenes]
MNALGVLARDRGDREAAKAWYRKSAAAGDAEGSRLLAGMLSRAEVVAEVEGRLAERARRGDVEACVRLGRSRELGGDLYAAQGWYEKAAKAGHVGAMLHLARISEEQGHLRQARAWRRKAAES